MAAITQLAVYNRPMRRYGSFAGKEQATIEALSALFRSAGRETIKKSAGRETIFKSLGKTP